MARSLDQGDINQLATQIAREVEGADLLGLYTDPQVQAGIHLGAVITKGAMLAAAEDDMPFMPEGVDHD